MDDVFIGEIRAFAFNWTPEGWLACDGGTYPINMYGALFSLLGYTWGGTQGRSFSVPNLQGRVMIGTGQLQPPAGYLYYELADIGGLESVGLDVTTVPQHNHPFHAGSNATAAQVTGKLVNVPVANSYISTAVEAIPGKAVPDSVQAYTNTGLPDTTLNAASVGPFAGGTDKHGNISPYLCINYCINWNGDYPQRP